jgi:hypothetical protein
MLSVFRKLACGRFYWFSGQYFFSITYLKVLGSSEISKLTESITPSFENFSFISWFPKLRVISDYVEREPALFWGMIKLVTISLRFIVQLSIYYSYPFSWTVYALHWYTTLVWEKSLKFMMLSKDFSGNLCPFELGGIYCNILPITWYSIWLHRYSSKNKTRSCCRCPSEIRFRREILQGAYFEIHHLRSLLSSSESMLAMKALFR